MRETIRCLVEFYFISYTSNKIRKCFSQILSLYNQTILFIKCATWPQGVVHHILGPREHAHHILDRFFSVHKPHLPLLTSSMPLKERQICLLDVENLSR